MILAFSSLVSFSQNYPVYEMGNETNTIMSPVFIGAVKDTVGVGAASWYYTIHKKSQFETAGVIRMYLDKQRGAATPKLINIIWQSSAFGIKYNNIDTIKYYGTVDSAVELQTDYSKGDYFRVLVNQATPTIKIQIDSLYVKFFKN